MAEGQVIVSQPRVPVQNFDFTTPAGLRDGGMGGNCPPELEYFRHVDQLIVFQTKELLESLTGFEAQNKYRVLDPVGQQVYFIQEESSCCWRYWCGPSRQFVMHMTDTNNVEVMRFRRPFQCVAPCCVDCYGCCHMIMYVECPPDNVIGEINMDKYYCHPKIGLSDERTGRFGTLRGPCCPCHCNDVNYPVWDSENDDILIGQTTKMWAGCCAESFTDADNFNIRFPMDMDPKSKAIMLASTIMVDFLIYEHH